MKIYVGTWRAFLIGDILAGTGAFLALDQPWRPTEPRVVVPRGRCATGGSVANISGMRVVWLDAAL